MQATTRVQSRRCSTWPVRRGYSPPYAPEKVFVVPRARESGSWGRKRASVCARRTESIGALEPRAPARPARWLELPLQEVSAPG
ncbi:MC063 [Molluscum contagiosum virus subtype 1]|uniref:MC063L n=1 Tax=Molluscum contagiosum virus TaxID=10279 RepID=A0A858A4T5_9POXV|nr:MC063 [Molluscum contagiosum virus subtype 1]QHW17869.1 MC063L [Molluscum contagiosum virus]AYO88382.1 MC063 [Molluscum contagiosum virus subtype 1]AYO88558.1 MC063 [Molluscum contagiosum virus subtype 1]AYO88912.1 MC063 [Molluscum contagiosum virus subtype 1]